MDTSRLSISDEQRRETAARLREYDVAEFKESAIVPFLECLGHGYKDWRGILDELANLIDRPTCRNIYAETVKVGACENGFKCSECGNTVEDCEGYRVSGEFNYCSKCGAEVVE